MTAISGPNLAQKFYSLVGCVPVYRNKYYEKYFVKIDASGNRIDQHENYLDVTKPSSNLRNAVALAALVCAAAGAVGGMAFFGMIPAIPAGVGAAMFIGGAAGTGVFVSVLLLQQGYIWGHRAAWGHRYVQTIVDTQPPPVALPASRRSRSHRRRGHDSDFNAVPLARSQKKAQVDTGAGAGAGLPLEEEVSEGGVVIQTGSESPSGSESD